MKFLYILIFVGSAILPLSPMGEEFTSSDALTLVPTAYSVDGRLTRWRPIPVSKHKLALSITNELSNVRKVYDFSSSEDTRVYRRLSETPKNYRTLFFTIETNSGKIIPDIQCTVSSKDKSRIFQEEIFILLLQNCENNEFVFSKKEIQIPLSEIEGPLDLRTVIE